MTAAFPRVTISVTDKKGNFDSAGDLNALSVGLGLFQAWIFITMFGAQAVFGTASSTAAQCVFANGLGSLLSTVYAISLAVFLLAIGLSNQLLLRFYVSKNALVIATLLAAVGTLLIFAVESAGVPATVLSGILMGASASLMIVLWGTAYARYEFATIIFNSVAAMVIGIVAYLALTNWILAPFSGGLTSLLPVGSSFLLWRMTPIPYYRRNEIPIFHPLQIKQTAFLLRFGAPSLVFGFSLGVLRDACMTGALLLPDISNQLIACMAAGLAVAVVVFATSVAHEESHWDMIFRMLAPVAAVALFCIPLLPTSCELPANLLIVCGFICFEALMWIFFSDLAQEFRLSPIYVFGLGRSFLTIGAIFGMSATDFSLAAELAGETASFEAAVAALAALVVAVCMLPRQREVKSIVSSAQSKEEQAYANLMGSLVSASASKKAEEESAEKDDKAIPVAPAEGSGEKKDASEGKAAEEQVRKGRFHMKCEEIADRYLLSRRETEVMFLLAKGHNAAYIQDKLCISKSTAKTHINHIYRKLDIHTQQELLNMVEREEKEQSPQEAFAKASK